MSLQLLALKILATLKLASACFKQDHCRTRSIHHERVGTFLNLVSNDQMVNKNF